MGGSGGSEDLGAFLNRLCVVLAALAVQVQIGNGMIDDDESDVRLFLVCLRVCHMYGVNHPNMHIKPAIWMKGKGGGGANSRPPQLRVTRW